MRVDKFLKNSRLIRRRTVAQEACEQGKVSVNGKISKSSQEVKVGDIITLSFGDAKRSIEVVGLVDNPKKDEACELYRSVD